jgi:hypothetical protein
MKRQQQGLLRWTCGASLAVAATLAGGRATVYRCGPDGRTFSEKPCADGGGRAVSVDDSRTDTERAAAHQVAQREARTADDLARDNRRHERSLRPGGAVSLSGPAKAEKAAKAADNKARKPKTAKPAAPEGFTAVGPGSEPTKRRPRD